MKTDSKSDEPRSSQRWQRFLGPSVVLFAGLLYVATAARTVQGGDSGELATISATGDVPHPPGYPLFVLWLRAFSWLPASSIAHRASLTTALSGVLAVALLQEACRAWGASIAAAAIATFVFAVSPLAWRLSTEPEVFMLNIALAMIILILAAPPTSARPHPFHLVRTDRQRALLLGLFAGLGLSNHHSIVLLAPLGLTAAISMARRTDSPVRTAAAAIGVLAIGLSPYLYLIYAARHPTSACTWGDTSTWQGLLHHFLRADYGTFNLAANARKPSPLSNLVAFFRALLVQSGGLSVVAFVPLARIRNRKRPSSLLWPAMFSLSLLTAGPLFIVRFNANPTGLGEQVVQRFYLLPLALLTVAAAVGATHLVEIYRLRVANVALVAVFLARLGFTIGERLEEAPYRGVTEAYVHDVLRIAPARSILLIAGDDAVGGFFYGRCALHLREDIDVVTPVMLLTDWYWPRVTTQLKLPKPITHGVRATPASEPILDAPLVMHDLLATNRPILLNEWFATTLAKRFPSYPFGPVIRIVGPENVPSPEHLLAETEDITARLTVPTLLHPAPSRGTWAGARASDYARPWNVLAEAFEREGESDRSAYCRDRARSLTPPPLR